MVFALTVVIASFVFVGIQFRNAEDARRYVPPGAE